MKQAIERIKELISKNKLDKAIEITESIAGQSSYYKSFILLKNRIQRLEKSVRLGIISTDDRNTEQNKILYSLLNFTEVLNEEINGRCKDERINVLLSEMEIFKSKTTLVVGKKTLNQINSIFKLFETIHEDYKKSISNYRNLIYSSFNLNSTHPIFDLIIEDHLLTKDLREKLFTMYNLPLIENEEESLIIFFKKFKLGIVQYFYDSQEFLLQEEIERIYRNLPRNYLYNNILIVFNLTSEEVDRIIEYLNYDSTKKITPILPENNNDWDRTFSFKIDINKILTHLNDDERRYEFLEKENIISLLIKGYSHGVEINPLIRRRLINKILNRFGEYEFVKKSMANSIIDFTIDIIQKNFSQVYKDYLSIKRELEYNN